MYIYNLPLISDQHDNNWTPEGEGGGDEGVRFVNHERTLVWVHLPLLKHMSIVIYTYMHIYHL